MPTIIVDSTCLIGLERIERLDVLAELFSDVRIPTAVRREFGGSPEGIVVDSATNIALVKRLRGHLDAGEAEVIAMATEHDNALLVLDDKAARSTAQQMGQHVIGTIGVLLRAKRQDLIPACKPLLDALIRQDFRVAESLYREALRLAGED